MNYCRHEILSLFLQWVGTSVVPWLPWYQVLLFQRVKASDKTELESFVHTLSGRVGRYLERQGLLVRDIDQQLLSPGDVG